MGRLEYSIICNPQGHIESSEGMFQGEDLNNIMLNIVYKPVSQSRTAAKSEKFWWRTGQSNLADRMEDCSIGQSAVV